MWERAGNKHKHKHKHEHKKRKFFCACTYLVLVLTSQVRTGVCHAFINVKLLLVGGRPGIGGGFELRSVFLFKCPAPGKSSWVKKVQIPHPRGMHPELRTICHVFQSVDMNEILPFLFELLNQDFVVNIKFEFCFHRIDKTLTNY